MKKLLFISSEFPPGPGGIGKHALSFLEAAADLEDISIRALVGQDYASIKEVQLFNNRLPFHVETFVNRSYKGYKLLRAIQVIQYIISYRPKRVFLSGKSSLWFAIIIRLLRPHQRISAVVHGSEITKAGRVKNFLNTISFFVLNDIYPVSTFTRGLLPRFCLKIKNVVIIENGLPDSFFNSAVEHDRNRSKEKSSRYPRLLTVGNVTARKGQHRLIKALPSLIDKFPNVHYEIVGLETEKNKLQALALQLGVEQRVDFKGVLSEKDLYSSYRNSDLFVMLSENQNNGDVEGFGIAILEANYFGLPALGAKYCGIEDAVSSENGILVDGNNFSDIVEGVNYILQNYSDLSSSSRKWAKTFRWTEIIKKFNL
ncbi:glycosyltransferase family 4 protein [Schleiferiaceae bacterium]|nr:glycosyltransferase family 4 protein [Schleiferiaceae bacterium]